MGCSTIQTQGGSIDYGKMYKDATKAKFKTLYDTIPFLQNKSKEERFKWIRYYKLKTAWEQQGRRVSGHLGDFNLAKIEKILDNTSVDWKHIKLENIRFPGVIECNFAPDEDCKDCKSRFKCKLLRKA
ncbi:MAG: hypothetical protein K8E24_012260 [Methanobacterium paludis]|nr:hypothetical protein [Methanobacterium paludis]